VVSAINWGGTGSATISITIVPQVPVITSASASRAATGFPFTYQITAINAPSTFGASGLPSGLSVDASTGLISGTPQSTGTFDATVTAANVSGTDSITLVLSVYPGFAGIKGQYTGLGSLSGTSVALFQATVTGHGGFTATFRLAGARYPLKGVFGSAGLFTGVTRSGSATVSTALTADPSGPSIDGTIGIATTGGIQSYTIGSSLVGTFNAHTIPHGLTGPYTVILSDTASSDAAAPSAPGFAAMTVATNGAIHINGELGDGTPFVTAALLHSDGKTCTFFQPLYGSGAAAGSIAGELTFESLSDSDGDSWLDWIKPPQAKGAYYPEGFAIGVSMVFAHYTPPPLLSGTASISVWGGNIATGDVLTNSFAISESSRVLVFSGSNDGLTLNLTVVNGRFNGSFLNPDTDKKTPFEGVIYQREGGVGFGLFRGIDETGSVEISQ
jgi:hypothetical protein